MRCRSLVSFLALFCVVRSFAACSHEAAPGENCEGGLFDDVYCPAGQECDDKEDWTCQDYPPPSSGGSSSDVPPSTDADADADADADPDAAAQIDSGEGDADGGVVDESDASDASSDPDDAGLGVDGAAGDASP